MKWHEINIESKKLCEYLLRYNICLSTAESCTGGMLASSIINNSGASKIFKMGYITYSNESKINELNVSESGIKKYGSVSNECALMMVNGLLHRTKSDIGVSITGIAGPTGGTIKKPVGLVWICISNKKTKSSHQFIFNGNRLSIRLEATYNSLLLLNRFLSDNYP